MQSIKLLTGLKTALTALTLLAAGGLASQAQAQSTRVIIQLPNIAILNYAPEVTVNVTAAALGALLDQNGDCDGVTFGLACDEANLSGPAAFAGPGFTWSATAPMAVTTPTFVTALNAVPLALQDVWAVRGIWTTTANVNAALGSGNVLANGTAQITVTAAATTNGGPHAPPGLAPGNAIFGGVNLTLDLTAATLAGTYANVNPTYTLDVVFN
jgi:hypothetical protein